jgi:hypothetical protein
LVGPGVHTIVLAVADARGNIGFCTTTMTVVDPNPPKEAVLRCPQEKLTAVCTSPAGAVVQYRAYAQAGCEEVPLKCDPPPGSVFPPGETKVTCVLDDPRFPKQQCSFVVVVTCQNNPTVPNLTVAPSASGFSLTAPNGGRLQTADSPAGPWKDVPEAKFPFQVDTREDRQQFFRVRE